MGGSAAAVMGELYLAYEAACICAGGLKKHVGRLEVTMDESCIMQVLHACIAKQ